MFIFPRPGLSWAEQRLTAIARQERDGEWFIEAANEPGLIAIYARIQSTSADPARVYCDWEPEAIEASESGSRRAP